MNEHPSKLKISDVLHSLDGIVVLFAVVTPLAFILGVAQIAFVFTDAERLKERVFIVFVCLPLACLIGLLISVLPRTIQLNGHVHKLVQAGESLSDQQAAFLILWINRTRLIHATICRYRGTKIDELLDVIVAKIESDSK